MNVVNPLYTKVYESVRVKEEYIFKKDIDKFSLCLSFLMAITFTVSILLSKLMGNALLLALSIVSFVLLVTSYILLLKVNKKLFLSISYAILMGLFLAFLSSYLSKILKVVMVDGIETYNGYAALFINISVSVVAVHLAMDIMYIIDAFIIRNFYIKYAIFMAFMIIISLTVNLFIKGSLTNYLLLPNSLMSVFVSMFYGFFLLIYNEEIRKVTEEGTMKIYIADLSVLKLTLLIYLPYEIINMLKKH